MCSFWYIYSVESSIKFVIFRGEGGGELSLCPLKETLLIEMDGWKDGMDEWMD